MLYFLHFNRGSDPNDPMVWIMFFLVSAVVLLMLGLIISIEVTKVRKRVRNKGLIRRIEAEIERSRKWHESQNTTP